MNGRRALWFAGSFLVAAGFVWLCNGSPTTV